MIKMARPTKRTPETEMKLEQAFSLGGTIESACFYAGIAPSSYHLWAEKDPEFSERMKALKQKPILKALATVVESLDDPKIAQWYLERRHEDFKPKQVVEHEDLPEQVVVYLPDNGREPLQPDDDDKDSA